jgi:hypothetical protein
MPKSVAGPGHQTPDRAADLAIQERAPHDGNHLAGSPEDAAHAVLAVVGYNFQLALKWQSLLCALILTVLANPTSLASSRQGTWARPHGRLPGADAAVC